MSKDTNIFRDKISGQKIVYSDTMSSMCEKYNNNLEIIAEYGGGPEGPEGPDGPQGVPTKPKNPVHVWVEGEHYDSEIPSGSSYEIIGIQDGLLTNVEYQEGHCIFLENGHVYVLETIGYNLVPVYRVAMQSYNPGTVVDGRNSYVHFAYANSSDGYDGFITGDEIRGEEVSTFNLRRMAAPVAEDDEVSRSYMGVYSDHSERSSNNPSSYIWMKIQGGMGLPGLQGEQGPAGPAGPQGDRGDSYTGHLYFIDLEGDMATINIDIDRTRLYDESNDYCECVLHAYYGNDSWKLPKSDVSLEIPNDDDGNDIGTFTLIQDNNDVRIRFVPDEKYVFPTKNLQIPITVKTKVDDPDNNETYDFERKTIWIIKPIMATFELEIRPSYRVIKIYEDGERYPKNLEVFVYKIEDTKRSLFDLSEESDFTLLWKYQDDDEWNEYTSPIPTEKSSCLELQIVRYWKSTDPEKQEEIWDYEDVWTVADGKGTHYYHADLGNAESMLVLTTGEKLPISDASDLEDIDGNYIAELRDPNGYSIIFEPHFYDGSTPLKVLDVDLASSAFDMENLYNGRFDYTFENITSDSEGSSDSVMQYKFTVTQVPYGISMIPLSFNVLGEYVELDQNGEPMKGSDGNIITEEKIDAVSFNIYISEIANIYSLQPSVTTFNTSKGVAYDKDDNEVVCDTIGCSVFRNGQQISSDDDDLKLYNLTLKWAVFQEDGKSESKIYTEPLVFGLDDDIDKDHFQSNDVMIEFILYYGKKEIAKSTVPLIKDGIDGRDGESWQYIFVRSNYYPFESAQEKDKILNPSDWKKTDESTGEIVSDDPNRKDNGSEYLGPDGTTWVDDHQGVDELHRYEYQSYRRWDVVKKEWSIYYPPTLYSNYSRDGVDGSGFLTTFSNPVAVIPVGESGYKCEENAVNQKDSTEVYFYNGSQNLSKYEELEISIDENSEWFNHFTVERIDGIYNIFFKPVVTNDDGSESIFDFGDEGNRFSIGVNVKYGISSDVDGDGNDEFYEGFVRWTLSPMKGLEDYEVFVDRHVVNTTTDKDTTFRVGYYKITTNGGKSFVEKYNPADGMNIKIHNNINLDELENVEHVDGESWGKCYYDFGNSDRCYVILLDKDGDIVDYTSVEAVTDGKDGYNGYHLELTQDYIALPWNEDKTGVNSKYDDSELTGTPISSKMILYTDNYKEIKSGITYEIEGLREDTDYSVIFEIDEDGHQTGKFTIPKEMFDGDNNLTCRAIYQNDIYEKVLFVDLEDTPYELELNKSILQRDKDKGELIDESISVKVKYWIDGVWNYTKNGKVVLTCDELGDEMLSDNGSNEYYIRTITFNNKLLHTSDRDVRISYYETDDNKNIIGEELSYEIIGILDNGKTGSSPYRLDLSNENVTLACDSEGNVYGTGYDENGIDSDSDPSDDVITTTVTLFYGSGIIKLNPEEDVSVTYNNKDIKDDIIEDVSEDGIIEYTLPATFLNSLTGTNNSINFKVKLPKSTDVLNATMSIGKIKSSYRYYLRPSVSSVVRYEDGSYSVDNGIIKCALWKQDGSKKPVEVTDADIVSSVIGYKFDENSELSTYDYNNGVYINSDCKEIWFEANENGALWDREIVPILKEGKNGSSPSCVAVDILGYSKVSGLPLYPLESSESGEYDMFNEWKMTIADVQADKGDTVYILQEYTWRPVDAGDDSSKDTKTRGITSTVAGVQGSNGRILFYLGTFEEGKETFFDIDEDGEKVIRDFIYGRLTKTVCDYYIDSEGNAWMRTGSEDVDGSDGQKGYRYSVSNNLSYWEPAQKVGFVQAGAITADMINVSTLVADEIFVNKLKASELEVEKSIVNQLDDKITNSTAIAQIKADNEQSLTEFRNIFTTEDGVNGLIEEAESGIITKAQEGMAQASMFAEYTKTSELDGVINGVIEAAKSGIITEAQEGMAKSSMFAEYTKTSDLDGVISTKLSNAGVITEANAEYALAEMFAFKSDVDGKVSKAGIIAAINESDESDIKISADKITLEGLKLESSNKSLEINLEDGQSYFGKRDETYIQINPDNASIHLQGEGEKWSITSETYDGLGDLVSFDRQSTGVVSLNTMSNASNKVSPYMPSTAGYGTFTGAGPNLITNLQKYGTLVKSVSGTTQRFTGLKKGGFKLCQTDVYVNKFSTLNITATPYNESGGGTYANSFFGDLYFVMNYQINGTISNVENTSVYKYTKFSLNKNNGTSFVYDKSYLLPEPILFMGDISQDNGTVVLVTSLNIYYVYEWAAATKPATPYTQFNITLTHSNDLILDTFNRGGRYEIFRNGFVFMSDYENFCASISGKSFTAVNGKYGMHIRKKYKSLYDSDDGIYIYYDGQWLKVKIGIYDSSTQSYRDTIDMSNVSLENVTSDFEF